MVSSRSSSTAIDDKNEENEEEKKRREKEEEEEEEEGVNGGNNGDPSSSLSTVEVLDFVGEATGSAISPRKKRNLKSENKDEGKGKGGRRTNAADDDHDDDAEWGRRSNGGPPPSLSMSLDLQNHPIGSASPQNDSGDYSNIGSGGGCGDGDGSGNSGPGPGLGPGPGPGPGLGPDSGSGSVPDPLITTETNNNAPSSCNIKLIGNNRDEEESYEGFGFGSDFGSSSGFGSVEVDADGEPEDGRDDADSPGGSSSAPSPTGSNPFGRNPRSPNSTIGRHSWLRTSLRRTPPCQLYRSGSFNSSGRGSNCDNTDDMYSDVSLEEDFIDLNHRLMCAIKQSCDSPSCPSYSTRQSDRIKLPSSHHSGPSYGYYPQPYPRYIQYEPYGVHHHPIPSYPSSCYNNHENLDEVFPKSKDKLSRQTWYLIIILILIIFALGYALYRTLSRTGQRFRSVRQANLVSSTQIVRKKKDAIQNCPAEFVRCAGMISELRKECSMPCKQCRKFPINISSPKIYKSMQITSSEMNEDEQTLNIGIIDIPRSKINVATDTPSVNATNI
ncbi:hypothetical protein HZH68_010411 [Vespula germanica]|uniref:Uncharacterized protein n=1 Tax=Vespula germanica TaxID=30212 RepID=A0A834JSL5_VESGE|nr:hypothetical protein HZH68_010411 [Vespula germanica]